MRSRPVAQFCAVAVGYACLIRHDRFSSIRPVALSEARSILIVKLDAMGDFVLATPFIRELRHAAPNAHIALVVSPSAERLKPPSRRT